MSKEIKVGNYLITICCDDMSGMFKHHRIILSNPPDHLVMLGGAGLITVRYCWSCGKKIQIKRVNQCQNQQ